MLAIFVETIISYTSTSSGTVIVIVAPSSTSIVVPDGTSVVSIVAVTEIGVLS